MTRDEFSSIKTYFSILSNRMNERNEDCENPKTVLDKGYSLAVEHMNSEISTILSDLEKQIWPK